MRLWKKEEQKMFHVNRPGKSFINREEYADKVLGCWTGKSIGGALGAPMEGKKELFDVSFYTQELNGDGVPNDDLDLQLLWLKAIEDHGIFGIDERVLGEYFVRNLTVFWNEYGVACVNLANGLFPPLSGFCNNEVWKNSNGAWIRSEIWACLFPGEPDECAPFAWCDSCIDHAEEGIYAEIFTVSLESAAFIESDLRRIIHAALLRIPEKCRVARSVKIVLDSFDAGVDWKTARNRVVEDSADLGWFQAPANVAYVILALIYGRGDFSRSICLAVNCGDDIDCTGATCGAVLGILKGRSGIPEKWIHPIGESIRTVAIDPLLAEAPGTLRELTRRVIRCKEEADFLHPALVRLTEEKTFIEPSVREALFNGAETAKRVTARPPASLKISLPFGLVTICFEKGPLLSPGESQKLTLEYSLPPQDNAILTIRWNLPAGWSLREGTVQMIAGKLHSTRKLEVVLTAGEFSDALMHIPLQFFLSGRNYPVPGIITFQRKRSLEANTEEPFQEYWDCRNRFLARQRCSFPCRSLENPS